MTSYLISMNKLHFDISSNTPTLRSGSSCARTCDYEGRRGRDASLGLSAKMTGQMTTV